LKNLNTFGKSLKVSLKEHRTKTFESGKRKEAHKTSFRLLKGQEKLTPEEKKKVNLFCLKHPIIAAEYALNEDIRMLYATVKTAEQA
jgi:hypothetical protein